jgi:cyclic pyranopterin phosphate synthase
LLRKGIEKLVGMIRSVEGVQDLTLTTNASLLVRKAQGLAAAGLDWVTVSLDALDDPTFQKMNDVGYPVGAVLEGIAAAAEAGLGPIKINAVVQRGVNDHAVLDMAGNFRGTPSYCPLHRVHGRGQHQWPAARRRCPCGGDDLGD